MWSEIISGSNDSLIFVDTVSNEVVGFIGGCAAREDHGFDSELSAIYLLKKFQSRGIGKKLFIQLKNSLIQRGFTGMYLWVLRLNQTSNFYKAMGGKRGTHQEDEIEGTVLTEDLYYWNSL